MMWTLDADRVDDIQKEILPPHPLSLCTLSLGYNVFLMLRRFKTGIPIWCISSKFFLSVSLGLVSTRYTKLTLSVVEIFKTLAYRTGFASEFSEWI
jgi:hypothetical protein